MSRCKCWKKRPHSTEGVIRPLKGQTTPNGFEIAAERLSRTDSPRSGLDNRQKRYLAGPVVTGIGHDVDAWGLRIAAA